MKKETVSFAFHLRDSLPTEFRHGCIMKKKERQQWLKQWGCTCKVVEDNGQPPRKTEYTVGGRPGRGTRGARVHLTTMRTWRPWISSW
jgi:hypothetical protein